MTTVETDAPCSLCGLNCGTYPLRDHADGITLPFCCSGCLNVHAILRASGVLTAGVDPRETELFQRSLALGLISTRESSKSVEVSGASCERLLRVSGIWCGACAWLIEHTLRKERGIALAEVYFASDLLKVRYDPRFVPPGHIESRLRSLGYEAAEYQQDSRAAETERKDLLLRLGVAAFLWVNV